jgi:hypothetical protein
MIHLIRKNCVTNVRQKCQLFDCCRSRTVTHFLIITLFESKSVHYAGIACAHMQRWQTSKFFCIVFGGLFSLVFLNKKKFISSYHFCLFYVIYVEQNMSNKKPKKICLIRTSRQQKIKLVHQDFQIRIFLFIPLRCQIYMSF